jgi:phosphoribosylanthranilate isomerase
MHIKICGITEQTNMMELARLQPEFMGFIFYAQSPRDVTSRIDTLKLRDISKAIDKVAVLVNHDLKQAISLVLKYGFQAVQLHGDEPPSYCSELGDYCMVIKAFSVDDKLPENIADYEGKCDMFLFDKAGVKRGGNSEKFDHSILETYQQSTPFLLSGGISPADTSLVINLAANIETFAGVDLNSKFETSPGIKDPELLSSFMKQIRL